MWAEIPMLKALVRNVTPAPIWAAASKLRASLGRPPQLPSARAYQGVSTIHSTLAMHSGRFEEAYERHWRIDPWNEPSNGDRTRMRIYNLCALADVAIRRSPGDLLTCGVAWGVAQRVLYDFLALKSLGRTLHMVDPFLGVASYENRVTVQKYNASVDLVRDQYPAHAAIRIHQAFIPDCLPLPNAGPFALAYFNTTDPRSEAKSLARVLPQMAPGGTVVIDAYAIDDGHQDIYDPALRDIRVEPFVLPTGQAVIFLK
jgi:hypothetical protein